MLESFDPFTVRFTIGAVVIALSLGAWAFMWWVGRE